MEGWGDGRMRSAGPASHPLTHSGPPRRLGAPASPPALLCPSPRAPRRGFTFGPGLGFLESSIQHQLKGKGHIVDLPRMQESAPGEAALAHRRPLPPFRQDGDGGGTDRGRTRPARPQGTQCMQGWAEGRRGCPPGPHAPRQPPGAARQCRNEAQSLPSRAQRVVEVPVGGGSLLRPGPRPIRTMRRDSNPVSQIKKLGFREGEPAPRHTPPRAPSPARSRPFPKGKCTLCRRPTTIWLV